MKRYIPFILLNVVISAAVVLAVLFFWEQRQAEKEEVATATSIAATAPAATAAAVATASAPPTLPPTPDLKRHVVRAGETLGAIAELYGVDWEDIAAFNQLDQPQHLSVGDELIIPIGGLPTPTVEPSPTATEAAPPTPIPTDPPAAGEAKVIIQEIVGAGDLQTEAVVLANEGTRQLQLANWTLEDSQGNVYKFNVLILFGGGAVQLHTRSGQDTTADLYWDLNFPVWESGETATVRDADGIARATFTVP